jgi:RNA polymerase sigma factor (sigma-70 family)
VPPRFEAPVGAQPWIEPELLPALAALTERQRVAVVLVHGFGWTHREVAELTDIAVTSVQNHVERGLEKLRAALEVHLDA